MPEICLAAISIEAAEAVNEVMTASESLTSRLISMGSAGPARALGHAVRELGAILAAISAM